MNNVMNDSNVTTQTTTDADAPDRTVRNVAICIVTFTLIYGVTAIALFEKRVVGGVLVGGAIACANFLVLARIGKALTQTRRDAVIWGAVYLLKVAALFGGVLYLLHTGFVSGLGLIVGFTALLPGIVVGGLLVGRGAPGPAAPSDPK